MHLIALLPTLALMTLARLKELFAQLDPRKPISIEGVFEEVGAIFEALVTQLEGAALERKQEILAEMQEANAFLAKAAASLYERAGMSEEEVSSRSESAPYYPAGYWSLVQSMRQRLNDLAVRAAKSLKTSLLEEKTSSKTPSPPKRPPGGTKRSDWLRS